MDNECDVCDGEGYVPGEECNDSWALPIGSKETPASVQKQEIGYWEMVKQEVELFNQQVIGRG